MKLICFDIGGTSIKHGVVSDGVILTKGSFETVTADGFEGIKNRMKTVTKQYLEAYSDISGVGVSSAGSIDFQKGVVLVPPPTLPEFEGWDISAMFLENFGLMVVADNDVNSFAAAECYLNDEIDKHNVVVLTLGTGIGGGIIIDGKIVRGKNYNAGEVGRMNINGFDWEENASTIALVRNAKKAGIAIDSGLELFDLYDKKDDKALKVVGEWFDYIALGIATLVYTLNPETFIIGGGVSARTDLCDKILEHTNRILKDGFKNTFKVIPAKFRNDGGLLGAYANFVKTVK